MNANAGTSKPISSFVKEALVIITQVQLQVQYGIISLEEVQIQTRVSSARTNKQSE